MTKIIIFNNAELKNNYKLIKISTIMKTLRKRINII